MLSIQPDRLKTLRKSRGFGRTRLAKLSGVSERQIARLEGALPAKDVMTEDLLLRLASALQTHPETLVGAAALTDADLVVAPQSRCCSKC